MIYILDSSIFQYQIFTYLLNGADYQRLAGFVHSIMKMLRPLHPALIYLYRENTEDGVKQVRAADCIFLMGGDVTLQMALIRDLGLSSEFQDSNAVILGVSAGAMNMGRYVAEIWESKAMYEGLV